MTYSLYCGDCLEYMRGMDAGSVDAVITDPPYGDNFYESDRAQSIELYRFIVDNFRTSAFFGYPERLVKICIDISITPDEWVVWNPVNKPAAKGYKLPKSHEAIAIFGKTPGAWNLFRPRIQDNFCVMLNTSRNSKSNDPMTARLGDVWSDASPGLMFNSHLRNHPNEKPVSVMQKLITLCSNERDTIFDPFMGSGTTGVACMQLGRNFIGCEIDPTYYAIAERRIKDAAAQPALFTLDAPQIQHEQIEMGLT